MPTTSPPPPSSLRDSLAELGASFRLHELAREMRGLLAEFPQLAATVSRLLTPTHDVDLIAATPTPKAKRVNMAAASSQMRAQWEARTNGHPKSHPNKSHPNPLSAKAHIEAHWDEARDLASSDAIRFFERQIVKRKLPVSHAGITSAYYAVKAARKAQGGARTTPDHGVNPKTGRPYRMSAETRQRMADAMTKRLKTPQGRAEMRKRVAAMQRANKAKARAQQKAESTATTPA